MSQPLQFKISPSDQGARLDKFLCGWDKLNSEKFDYLICVSFNETFNDVRYFIFTKKEVWGFSNKKCVLLRNDEDSNRIIKSSENKWKKIVQ